MTHHTRTWVLGLVACTAAAWSPSTQAEDDGLLGQEVPICRADDPRAWGIADPAPLLLGARPVDAQALGQQRGGAQTVSLMKLQGVVADNHASELVTGQNSITDGAFSGAAGLPTVIQNSGNNVLIQNATIVNVQVQ